MIEPDPSATRRVVFQYLVPVHVEVEDGLVVCVTIIDETPVRDPSLVEGDAGYLTEALWPAAAALIARARVGKTTGVVKLDPAVAARGKMSTRWGLWINTRVRENES